MTANIHNSINNNINSSIAAVSGSGPANPAANRQAAIGSGSASGSIAGSRINAGGAPNPVLSPRMSLKFAEIKSFFAQNKNELDMNGLVKEFLSHTENTEEGDKKCLFRKTEDLRHSETLLKNLTVMMAVLQVFGKEPRNLAGGQKALAEDLNRTLTAVIRGEYAKNPAAGRAELDRVFADLARKAPGGALSEKQESLLNGIKSFYAGMTDTQSRVAALMQYRNSGSPKITLENPGNIFGLGHVLPSQEEDIGKLINGSPVSPEDLARKIDSGEASVRDMTEDSPEYRALLREYSETARISLDASLDLAENRLQELNSSIRNAGITATPEQEKTFLAEAADILKEFRSIRAESDAKLTPEDQKLLFSGDRKYETLIGNVLDGLRDLYAPGSRERGSIDLMKQHPQETLKLLDSLGFSADLFGEFIGDRDALKLYFKISDAKPGSISDQDFRSAINSFAAKVFDPHLSDDSSLLLSIIKGISPERMSDSQKIILEHLPQKLELTQDVFECLSSVLSGLDIANGPLTPGSISLDNLKKAYQAVCNPGDELKRIMSEHGGKMTFRNMESFILRAAYHQFRAEHAADSQETFGGGFRDNAEFRRAMGIADRGDTSPEKPVDISRYEGFDPLNVRMDDMSAGGFITSFNILCANSDFLEAAKKLPAVHLADRVAQALNIDLKRAFESDPALSQSYEAQETPADRLEWFRSNLPRLTELYLAGEGALVKQIENENRAEIENRRNDINALSLQDLADLNNINAGKNGLRPVSSVEELLVNTDGIRGGKEIGYLVSFLNQIRAASVTDFIPEGKTFLGLRGSDFLNPACTEKIRKALAEAPESVMTSPDYKDAFRFFAKMQKAIARAADKTAMLTAGDIGRIALKKKDINAALNMITGAKTVYKAQYQHRDEFEVLDRKDYLLSDLRDYCLGKESIGRTQRMEMLGNLNITEKMFDPENNIFVKDKEAGKAKCRAIKAAVAEAVREFKTTARTSRDIMSDLIRKVNAELAGDKTLNIARAVTMLVPHNEHEVLLDPRHSITETVAKDIRGLFKKSLATSHNPVFRGVVDNVSIYSRDNIFFVNTMMESLKEFSLTKCASLDQAVKQNRFASLMVDRALRKTAYENGFKTIADMKKAFLSDEGKGKLTKNQLIDQAVNELKKDFAALDENTLRNIVLGAVESDIYGRDTGKSSRIWAGIKKIGRAMKNMKLLNMFKGLSKTTAVKSAARALSRKTAGETRHLAKSMLESLDSGSAIVHNIRGEFSIGVGLAPRIPGTDDDTLKLKAGIALTDGLDLQVETDGEGKYRFVMGASLGGKLFAEGGFKAGDADIAEVKAEAKAGYQRTYEVTFDNLDNAAAFLSKIMIADLTQKDMAAANEVKSSHTGSLGASISGKADPLAAGQKIAGKEINSAKKPVTAEISAGAGAEAEWTYERGVNHYRHSVHTSFDANAGFEVSLSPRNIVLGDADKESLSPEDKEAYEKKEAALDFADRFIKTALAPDKAAEDYLTGPMAEEFMNIMGDHPYSDEEKEAWGELTDMAKFQADRNRYFAECLAGFATGTVAEPAVNDVISLRDYLLKKLPGAEKAGELLESVTDFFGRMASKLDGPHARFSFEVALGKSTEKILSVTGGVKCHFENTLSYETNALETSLRSAERVTRVMAEDKGGSDNVKQKNTDFLKASLKKLGVSRDEIAKAVNYLSALQRDRDITISDFEIRRTAKKSSLHALRGKIKDDQAPGEQYKGLVKSLKNEDFELAEIVFHTSEGVHEGEYSFGVKMIAEVGTKTAEKQVKVESHTLRF